MKQSMFEISQEPLSVEDLVAKVTRRECGAIATFIGTVREFTQGKQTLQLEYQAYESMAIKKLQQIGQEVEEKWPGATVAISHRIGLLQISDIAVIIAVSTPHRKAAYEANAYAMERIKEMVPIWKKEYWHDGTKWIGDQAGETPYPLGEPHGGGESHD
ncbi:molybdenum cofactor biosynthesis protein MoaE [Halalkalibacter hemicellulosilyticus]|uniref:Molybdopterin synthase catalytic subunit n=1 Tax=Halalkalibacter hemicellulosilyticusJCM 9152 TaxID=1236971 RepID=W4QMB9_9BACI|nr:molybdenum cofactor biosynthesis protein MoaE [Halalkalibacter hemicellulosilyticus]GAE32469.1 molybdenum cofactor biosynthesis protein MoaE [Halalkalibacter hemicellulosilyticusJCM 9152]